MALLIFDVKQDSKALDYFGYDLETKDCVVVYKNNPVGYVYRDVDETKVEGALQGLESLGQLANSLKDPSDPAETCNFTFQQNNVEIKIGSYAPFVAPVVEVKTFRDSSIALTMENFWKSYDGATGFNDQRAESSIQIINDGIHRSYAW